MIQLLCEKTLAILSLIVAFLLSSTAFAQTDLQNNAIDLICLTDQPAIMVGETIRLQAIAAAQDGTPMTSPVSYEWQVSQGTIRGVGADVEWNLSGVGIASGELHKKVTATVKALSAGQAGPSCSVEVFIGKRQDADKPEDTRGGLITGRRYLLPSETEPSGYGLYSYFLLSARPGNEEERERYLKILGQCLQVMHELKNLGRYVRPSQLNVTYVPVTELPKGKEDDLDFAKKVLSMYDFDRAKVLLNKFEKTYDRGPYLISVKPPLTQAPEPLPIHILLDFTDVPLKLAARSVKDFEFLAAQQRTWSEQSMRVFPTTLRKWIAIAGKEAPEVAVSLKSMIQFIKLGE